MECKKIKLSEKLTKHIEGIRFTFDYNKDEKSGEFLPGNALYINVDFENRTAGDMAILSAEDMMALSEIVSRTFGEALRKFDLYYSEATSNVGFMNVLKDYIYCEDDDAMYWRSVNKCLDEKNFIVKKLDSANVFDEFTGARDSDGCEV